MLFSKYPDDIKRFQEMTNDRRRIIDNTPATPLPQTYAVNELSKALHPNVIPAEIVDAKEIGRNCKIITLKSTSENGRFPYFRAGQFITISARVGDSFITRPYSISSSPYQAMQGIMEVIVQKAGLFSSYLLEEAKVGDKVVVGEPTGDFYYDNIRDRETIVAIAGGSGITPFISMIKSIIEGSDDFNLIVFYGVRTRSDLLMDLDSVKHEKIKVIPVLSYEEVDGYEHGFITKELISKYVPAKYSVFMCGPDAMYNFVTDEFVKLGLDRHSIRQEHNSIGDRQFVEPKVFKLTVHIRDQVYVVDAYQNETLVCAMERAGLAAPVRCKSGSCGFCHSRLVKGEVTTPEKYESRRAADKKFGYIHPCCTYPDSDLEIDVPPFVAGEMI